MQTQLALTTSTYPVFLHESVPEAFPYDSALNTAQRLFATGDTNATMRAARLLRDTMAQARNEFTNEAEWRAAVERIRTHPVLRSAHQDPFVHRCWSKPRGYAGDAVLLDYIYDYPRAAMEHERVSPAGRASMLFTTDSVGPRAVRNRGWLLASEIDATCRRVPDAEILSLACGHLRESAASAALKDRAVKRFLALDQDEDSLAVVRESASQYGVEAAEGSVRSVIARGRELGKFDFVYAAGLYDYLNDKVAARLLRALFELTKPGGKVWIANFLDGIVDQGFMESFMDWWLIYRSEEEFARLADGLPAHEVASARTFVEHENNIVFLEVTRHA